MKDYQKFKRIIKYCKLMNYDVNDILNMSDNELRLWYTRVLRMTENEKDFQIRTGMTIDQGTKHKIVTIIESRWKK